MPDPVICDKCLEYENKIARLFTTFEELQESGLWAGDDQIQGDPVTTIAVWIGKTNAERGSMKNWWFCCPAHPNCSHIYIIYFPSDSENISAEDREEIWGAFGLVSPEEDIEDVEKGNFHSGFWTENNCSCGSSHFYENDFSDSLEWFDNYIENRLKKDIIK
ncbi:MAG: hypothetical protein OEY34_01560 [Cyclobacteriaceae bacterium]|nr:hypothetical protein [Cyclobacteriaceae bacterium]